MMPIPVTFARVPDAGELSIVGYGMAVGGPVGGGSARLLRQPPQDVSRLTLDGAFVGGIIAFAAWIGASVLPYLR